MAPMAHTHRVGVEMQSRQLFTLGCYTVTYPWGRCKIARSQDCKITSPSNCSTSIYLASYYCYPSPNLAPEALCSFWFTNVRRLQIVIMGCVVTVFAMGVDDVWTCDDVVSGSGDYVVWVMVMVISGDISYLYTTTNMSRYGECNNNMRCHPVAVMCCVSE